MNELQKRIALIETEIEVAKVQQKRYNKIINDGYIKVKKLLRLLNPPKITVCDHAMVRYLERLQLLDTDLIKSKILKRYSKTIYDNDGTVNICEDGVIVVVENFVIITFKMKNNER